MSKINPISPNEINIELPDFVVQAVNNLLKEKYRGGEVTLTAKEIITEGKKIGGDAAMVDWYEKKYMDFEEVFEVVGWTVSYHSPDRGGSDFESFYRFKS